MKRIISAMFYQDYLDALLQGKRADCGRRVQQLLDQNIEIKNLYTDLFQKSLYEVGRLWELNRISVAREHLVTAITEGLLGLVYPRLFDSHRPPASRKVVISCAANEYHQIGGKMVADVFEMNGWESHFLGANTPIDEMLTHISDTTPDLVGLSLSVYFNLASLKKGFEAIRADFPNLDILVGGQAFQWGATDFLKRYPGTHYVASIEALEDQIASTTPGTGHATD
ncbi:MAG: cobalamin-dependent protein [Desulfobacterales bacterium]|jgi:methanogenic corrinoid protein MtbC1|nr:cobalamin-dependent protein [Desulfobacterales bacterium]